MTKIVHPIITFALAIAVGFLFWRYSILEENINSQPNLATKQTNATPEAIVHTDSEISCEEVCQSQIEDAVNEAIAAIEIPQPTTTETVVEKTDDSVTTTYVSLGSTYSTTSTDWVDMPDSKVYLDLANDYSEDAYVTWEVSLKVAHGNGAAHARLFDETHGIAVDGSELSTENNSVYSTVKSSSLPLWRGNNLYKIQLKSLNSFEVTASGGKVKVKY